MRYSDEELAGMLADLESELVERKRSAADRSAIHRTICAFANDLAGHGRAGVILVGVEDDGRCAGTDISDDLLTTLAQMRCDGSIQPLPTVTVEKRTITDCTLAVVTVAPALDTPVRYQGRAYVRVGPTVQPASPEDERVLTERRRAADLSWDLRPNTTATLADLDLDYFQTQYLRAAVHPDVLERNQRPLTQQLESLRLTLHGAASNGALLVLGRDPQRWIPGAYVQFLRIDGSAITDPIRDQKALSGRLDDVLRRMDELVELGVSVRTAVATGSRELQRPDYPVAALQQLVRNALMHRAYDGTNAPVKLYWYTDRIEIMSPGGLYGRVTPQNFGTGVTDYRNPLVAEAMHHLGYAQRFGLGVPLAREQLEKNGNSPPEFLFESTHVAVIIRAAP